jgi:MFS family permease
MVKYPRNVIITTLGSLLTDISSEMIVYLLPLFLAGVLRTPIAFVGLIEGVAETTASFTKLFSGYFSDRLGKRKELVVAGYGLSTVAKGLLVIANAWPMAFFARFADRLGKGIRTAPRDALIADSVDESRRGAAFGFHRAGDTLGAFIGVGISALVVWLTQQQAVQLSRETFITLVFVSMIPAALAVAVLALGLREIKGSRPAVAPKLSLAGFDAPFKTFLVIVGLFTLGNSADAFIVLRAQDRGASIFTILLMVLGFNLTYLLAAQPLGRLSDTVGRKKLLVAGWTLYALVYLGFALSQSALMVAALWAAYGLYYALTEGTSKAFIADLVPAHLRGTAYGLYNATVGLLALPASLLAGVLWQAFGAPAPFLFGGVMALVASALLLRQMRGTPRLATP